MKRAILFVSAICMAVMASAVTVNYTADDSSIFPNPERGFITMLEGHLSTNSPYAVKGDENTLERLKQRDCMSIVLVHYYLENFRTTSTLPAVILNAFDEDMQVLRDKGLKAIIRFSYTNGTYMHNNEESARDASLSIVQSHISQYASHWQDNADVIFVFQAGFVGAWGEWYYTDNFGNQSGAMNDNRRAVVDALLAAVPQDRCVQLRTAKFKTDYLGSTQPLTAAEAYAGTPKARLAHHNDAFLYGSTEMGTYTDTATQKPYIAQETLYVPIGGESNIESSSQAATDASYARTTAEMSRLHWTFIQGGFSEVVTNRWRNDGTFDELNRKMGYRYQLLTGTYSDQVAAGGKLSVLMQIRNAGYAPLYNERPTYIVLKNGNNTYTLPLQSDPRTWLPNGVVTTVAEQLTIPRNVPEGTYQLYLYMPDAYSSLADDPRYAVRFANEDVWNEATGMNALNATITVSGQEEQQETDPTGAVLLPGTLNRSNVNAYSDDMSWYNGTYFDFGPEDAPNTERWAQWVVNLRYPGEYILTEVMSTANGTGHSWQLQLIGSNEEVLSSYTSEGTWDEGEITYDQTWDMTDVTAGTYVLRVQNAMEWGQPKLKSLQLQYDGELPNDIPSILSADSGDMICNQPYDILGRKVDDNYQGVVIVKGQKVMQVVQ